MGFYGYAAAIIYDGYGIVLVYGNLYIFAVPSHCFIDAVVDYLVDQVMQAPAVGGADVHAGTQPYMLNSLQDFYFIFIVDMLVLQTYNLHN